jgi:hypothetical protein
MATQDKTAGDSNGRQQTRQIPTTPLEQRSLGELIATLSRDVALLVHQEIELVKTDLMAGLKKTALGAAGLAVAAVLAMFCVPVISIAIALGIHALGVSLGWSFLIVGGAYLVLAAAAAAVGVLVLRKAKPPKRAVESVKADLHAIARKPTPAP